MTDIETWREAFGSVDASPALVVVESSDGSVGDVLDGLPSGVQPVKRAVAAEASRVMVGASAAGLGFVVVTTGVLVVVDVNWPAASSLGRLQRLVARTELGVIVVLGRRPGEGWAFEGLADYARRRGALVE